MDGVIDLSTEDLRKLQLIELEILVEADRICRKNNICYSLDGGTLLGAVRHKGFIPWDDDVDIMFLHDEYEKFYEACKTDLDTSRFFFQDYRTDPGYRWGYGKIRRLGTEYVKKGQEQLKQKTGICIDLFDLESLPDDDTEKRLFECQMFCIRKLLYSALGKTSEKKLALRIWYSILYLLPDKTVHKIKNKITSKYNSAATQRVKCLMWPEVPDGFPRRLFSSYIDLRFEGINVMAIRGYDEYLKIMYGNYMKLPPLEQRKGVMNAVKYSFIDVSYEEIMEKYNNSRTQVNK